MKFSRSPDESLEIQAKLWKNARFLNATESFKKFMDLHWEADDFQNLIASSLSKDTSFVKFSGKSAE